MEKKKKRLKKKPTKQKGSYVVQREGLKKGEPEAVFRKENTEYFTEDWLFL